MSASEVCYVLVTIVVVDAAEVAMETASVVATRDKVDSL